jgi:hypothetical protein
MSALGVSFSWPSVFGFVATQRADRRLSWWSPETICQSPWCSGRWGEFSVTCRPAGPESMAAIPASSVATCSCSTDYGPGNQDCTSGGPAPSRWPW